MDLGRLDVSQLDRVIYMLENGLPQRRVAKPFNVSQSVLIVLHAICFWQQHRLIMDMMEVDHYLLYTPAKKKKTGSFIMYLFDCIMAIYLQNV